VELALGQKVGELHRIEPSFPLLEAQRMLLQNHTPDHVVLELDVFVIGPDDKQKVPPAHTIELVVGDDFGGDQAAELAEQVAREGVDRRRGSPPRRRSGAAAPRLRS
jgi:hypothetical protein